MAKKKVAPRRKKQETPSLHLELVAIGLLALAVLLAFSLWQGAAEMGLFGLTIRRLLLAVLGNKGGILLILVLFWFGVRLLFKGQNKKPLLTAVETLSGLSLLLILLTAFQLWEGLLPIQAWSQNSAGGFVGNALVWALISAFGTTGSWLLLTFLFLIGLVGLTRLSLADALKRLGGWLGKKVTMAAEKRRELKAERSLLLAAEEEPKLIVLPEAESEVAAAPESQAAIPLTLVDNSEPSWSEEAEAEWKVEQLTIPDPPPEPVQDEPVPLEVSEYQLPPVTLLKRSARPRNVRQNRDAYENSKILERTFADFGIKAKVIQATKGPAVTRYEIQPAPGTKISRVTSLADDLALNLACSEVRIEAPIPGKAAIGIEVPNETVTMVTLRDVIETPKFMEAPSLVTVALGKDITGETIVADLAEMPHLLIAGATGSGKSVCLNCMITSILFRAMPNEVRFLLIDPKVVELAGYNGIPHLLAPVVNQPKKAAAALKWATGEMERRYSVFAKAGVRDITRYNEWAVSSGKEKLPFIVIIIDELADLMMVARADVEDAICRLAQMARAAGMHLVIGTQRPSTDVITGLIKANIPSRISFAVSSAVDSRVILDMGGAEKLLGKGDMLFAPVGLGKPRRVQGAYISNHDIEQLVDFVGEQMETQYVESLCRLEENAQVSDEEDRDELFTAAMRVVVEAGQASVSLLQRRLRVGYTRAARIIDQLEVAGVVGPYEGSKPRLVYKNKDLVKSMLQQGENTGSQ